ncbi:NAD(P)/FAD-dependent oxidoreductase [Mycolicibacter minnesotensis]
MAKPKLHQGTEAMGRHLTADVLVVGAGPAGASAAAWAARDGRDVLLIDMAPFPRDKTCGDGLTPRALAELDRLGLSDWVREHPVTHGLHAFGWGHDQRLPWPDGGSFPKYGSVITRAELDHRLVRHAEDCGARTLLGVHATGVRGDSGRIASVELRSPTGDSVAEVSVRTVLVADGVRSKFGTLLGRRWHRDSVYGTAMRAFMRVEQQHDWLIAHLALPYSEGETFPGYGWVFPLGESGGHHQLKGSGPLVNVGVMAYAAKGHELNSGLRPHLDRYVAEVRDSLGLSGEIMLAKSALLPLGGAVSNVAGQNWMLIGDAAGCVNPFTGEGIDYALETGRLAAEHLDEHDHSATWPHRLNYEYGPMFAATRRFARGFFKPKVMNGFGQTAIRSQRGMNTGLRLIANLIDPADKDLSARLAKLGGAFAQHRATRKPFLTSPTDIANTPEALCNQN